MNINRFAVALTLYVTFVVSPETAQSQVFDPGPSDPALFTTVINLPPDPDIGAGESISGSTQLNVSDGGRVQNDFTVNSGSEVNISDGSVGIRFRANEGSEVNISGGFVGSSFSARSLVNISGGTLGIFFGANSGSEVNISGGSVGRSSDANSGSVVNISGGLIGSGFDANRGSEVNISGGAIGADFQNANDSVVNLFGGEFRLNGSEFTGQTITLIEDDVFTGTLADGSSFIFATQVSDSLSGVRLNATALPEVNVPPVVIDSPITAGPWSLRSGETLTLVDGGMLRNFAVVGGTLNVQGGTTSDVETAGGGVVNISGGDVRNDFTAFDSEVNISGGIVGFGFDANSGSVVNISGGIVASRFNANFGSEVNISGGAVGGDSAQALDANSGSVVNISGGILGNEFNANEGSEVNISGGAVGLFNAASGSDVELFGGEFRLNGEPFTDQTITLAEDDVFTGTLSDGSSFIFSSPSVPLLFGFESFLSRRDNLSEIRLSATPLPTLDVTPVVIDSSVTEGPSGLRSGQTFTLVDGGSLRRNFAVVDATLNVQGGTLGQGVETAGGVVNISGGTVGSFFEAYSGSEVNISGGIVGDDFLSLALTANSGSVVNISGGLVTGVEASPGSVVNITGGTVDIGVQAAIAQIGLNASSGSEVNISGGTVTGGGFFAQDGSEVNIRGTQFSLNGELLDELVVGETFTITEPIQTLEGILADGSSFSFRESYGGAVFSPDATLTVTLSSILGDVNVDGEVNFLDISPFIALLSAGNFQEEADIDGNGVVNFLDIAPFIRLLTEQ